jgi:asparagine synthetase B (glutamine-hydrolysing)
VLYSGGLASSALLTATPSKTAATITVDLDHDPNELTRSDVAAAHLGHVREIETIARPVSTLIDEVNATSGEPVGDPAALTEFAVCRAAAKHAALALTAHGAALLWSGRVSQPRLWDDRQRRAIYTRGFAWQVRDANGWDGPADARAILANQTIPVAAHAAAAAGIELRFPFLDRQAIEIALSTPAAVKRRGRVDLVPLRQLVEPHIPARLMPASHSTPASQPWLPAALTVLVPRMLLGPRFDGRGIVSRPALQHLWNEHVTSRADHARRLWALVMLEFWFRASIDGDAAAEPLEYAVLLRAA